jgi:hypothetical protein
LVTAEAARSQLIYQICQQILRGAHAVAWGDVQPLLNNWQTYSNDQGKERYHHKRRPIAYGPLGVRDYYPGTNREIDDALRALTTKGIVIDM